MKKFIIKENGKINETETKEVVVEHDIEDLIKRRDICLQQLAYLNNILKEAKKLGYNIKE